MKVISIIQPWATLKATGEKGFETRSWATKYRGELATHASKRIDKQACRREPIKSALAKHGYDEHNLPTGCIIAISNMKGCHEVIDVIGDTAFIGHDSNVIDYMIEGNEFAFGNYSEGRFAWDMRETKQIEPIPAKGRLGLWNYMEPII